MARLQLALNVGDLEAGVDFYSKLLGVEPAKLRPGYANFEVEDPPLKLVLVEDPTPTEGSGGLNHLGIEVDSSEEVASAAGRLGRLGLAAAAEERTSCCYALQDKVWLRDTDGLPWEIYTVLADSPTGPCPAGSPEPCAGPR